jgi:hypothetical protein
VKYSEPFNGITPLICEYQACLRKVTPLEEKDVLFLLGSRFATETGADVYMEIKRPGDIQVFDSKIVEPNVSHPSGD